MNPEFLTISQAAQLIEKGVLSPVDLVEHCLARISCIDSTLNSFICLLANYARNSARIAEKEIKSGNYKGALHGIPLGLKDIYDMAGISTTCHSKVMQNYIAANDSYTVRKLKQAGAIIVGKLATHEFALGGPSFDLPWPPARNPWDQSRFTGGSSSGSAAAVAAGLVLGSMGSDSGGSIRTPSAYCGITGLKPTFGLISRSGIVPLSFTLDHAGPMAWTSEDCAILLQALAGFDHNDSASVNVSMPDYRAALTGNVRGLRLGVIRHFYNSDISASPAICHAIESSLKQFEKMGCLVEEVQLSPLMEWAACGTIIMLAEGYALHEKRLQEGFADYGEFFRDRMALGALISSADYIHAVRKREVLKGELHQIFCHFDALITAVTANEAPKIEAVGKFSIIEKPLLTMPFNVTGNPALSICCGYSENDLPLGMQIVGKHFAEATILRLADAYERTTVWRRRPPFKNETCTLNDFFKQA